MALYTYTSRGLIEPERIEEWRVKPKERLGNIGLNNKLSESGSTHETA